MSTRTAFVVLTIALCATLALGTNSRAIAKPGGGYTVVIEGRTDGGTTRPSNVVGAVRPTGVRPERPQFQSPPMPAATPEAILLSQDFNGTWSTLNPPAGWTITFTGDGPDNNDWYNGGGYAALSWYPVFDVGQTDILMSPVVNCSNYTNILLQCYTDYSYFGGGYTAVIEGSTDGGTTWPITIRNYNDQDYGPGTEAFNINTWAGGQSQVRIRWRGYGDIYNINWWYVDNVLVIPEVLDAAAISIDSPVGTVCGGGTYNPKATVQNLGNSPESFDVAFSIEDGSGYASTKPTPVLNPNEKSELTFDPWQPAGAGTFETKCSTELAGDIDNTNDKQVGTVKVWPTGWAQTAPVPLGPGTRVKHGGWLAHKPLDQYVYASKGGATGEFYRYDIEGVPGFEWKTLASIPGYGALRILPGDG